MKNKRGILKGISQAEKPGFFCINDLVIMKNMPTEFQNKVYQILKTIPAGRLTTYKKLAEEIGSKAYRAVGTALANNPYAPEVPCHRVVASDGTIGGFMGKKIGKTIQKKKQMLIDEGVKFNRNKIIDFKKLID